tara:strand:+ start:1120 stop:1686 length:567 start_codon:yes stop_codon:yes gene_type:complete
VIKKTNMVTTFPNLFGFAETNLEWPDMTDVWPMQSSFCRIEHPELEGDVRNLLKQMLHEMGYDRQDFKTNDMWLNRYDEDRPYLDPHVHQNSAFTGTFFPQDANHITTYYDPMIGAKQMMMPKVREWGIFNNGSMDIEGEQGLIVMHPSYVMHSVKWKGGKPSFSISFDVSYAGSIGDKEFGSYNESI